MRFKPNHNIKPAHSSFALFSFLADSAHLHLASLGYFIILFNSYFAFQKKKGEKAVKPHMFRERDEKIPYVSKIIQIPIY